MNSLFSVLPTNAAVETIEMADGALWFLDERTDYWKQQPKPTPPLSELGMKLTRTRTFHTEPRSNSTLVSLNERPYSAADIHDTPRNRRKDAYNRKSMTSQRPKSTGNETSLDRPTPIGQSAETPKSDRAEDRVKTIILDTFLSDMEENPKEVNETKQEDDTSIVKTSNKSVHIVLPGNAVAET